MQQSTESHKFLPDFVSMTNYCEDKGYNVEFITSKKGVTCDVYLNEKLLKIGSSVFVSCMDAQKESYSKIYMALNK